MDWAWEVPEFLNIAVACTDAHLGTAAEDRVAMIVEDDALGTSSITYGELAQRTSRFAQLLRAMGVAAGDRVSRVVTRDELGPDPVKRTGLPPARRD